MMHGPPRSPWHRRHRQRHGGWRARWNRLRRVRARVLTYLVLGFGLGALAGIAFGGASAGQSSWCFVVGAVLMLFPLANVATLRIAGPIRELAKVAQDLKGGDLGTRDRLPERDDEVGEVAGALRGMADRVVQQLQRQRALLAAVSHELRSPLARVRVLVELAREGRAPEGLHDDLQAEIDGMDALVGDLLAASRIDFEAVSPRELAITDVCDRAIELADLQHVTSDVDEAGAVQADPTLLSRALAVMLDNAGRYGAPPVTLEVRHEPEGVRFSVLDEGPGFSPGEEEQAFEPFWRRPGRSHPGGAGLGLALVRQIAQAHGGRAWAENRPEGGARVSLQLPHD